MSAYDLIIRNGTVVTEAGVGIADVAVAGGVSHNPAESVTVEDAAAAIHLLTRFAVRRAAIG